jgi:predicted ATPase with chaperone activity
MVKTMQTTSTGATSSRAAELASRVVGGPLSTPGFVPAMLAGKPFQPLRPRTLEETGLPETMVDSLLLKRLAAVGSDTGRSLANDICLAPSIIDVRLQHLTTRQMIMRRGTAPLGDYIYALTEQGLVVARQMADMCAYRGAAPVPFEEYITSVDAQTIRAEKPKREHLESAFRDISINPELFDRLGPAVNSGAGLFLYGAPGNGKTTLAERITLCFGHDVWIPKTLIAEGEIIKFFDPAYHHATEIPERGPLRQDTYDARWISIRRPTVVVGGELTMDSLEIRHSPRTNISEAPLQLKSNCGSLLIDDFGRQRVNHVELLNRWIVPLEKHYDFLTLSSGKKVQAPFDQLIIFSTNLDPLDLVDEAFLRRIPYKINVPDPDEAEFHRLFQLYAPFAGCDYDRNVVEDLLARHYRPLNRPMRRCHPRDLLMQIYHHCSYNGLPVALRSEYMDGVVENYFTVIRPQDG